MDPANIDGNLAGLPASKPGTPKRSSINYEEPTSASVADQLAIENDGAEIHSTTTDNLFFQRLLRTLW
ncbi:hypothetical protein ACTACD_02810 [Pseudomonas syringae]|uniref:hypothetical protein n=1 Tax=Pseudomonas syringae TaxID=317 RepID=UPI003F75BADD